MQPYFFPYIGYFQLINAVDVFVLYDDVQYIKNGWINRNRMLVNGKPCYFTMQIKKSSTFDKINQKELLNFDYDKIKFFKSMEMSYRRAPYYNDVLPVLQQSMMTDTVKISELACNSIKTVCNYLGIKTYLVKASEFDVSDDLNAAYRVIWFNKKLNSNHYINTSYGESLYSKEVFEKHDIKLNFLQTKDIRYIQYGNEYVQDLSIIDVLMFNSKSEVMSLLDQYELI